MLLGHYKQLVEVEVEGREEVVVVLDQDTGRVMVLGMGPGVVTDMVLVVGVEAAAEKEGEVVEEEVEMAVEAGQVLAMGSAAGQAMGLVWVVG